MPSPFVSNKMESNGNTNNCNSIQHSTHKHPIVLYDVDRELPCRHCLHPLQLPEFRCTTCRYTLILFCLACDRPIAGPTYVCSRECHFFIHKGCLDLWPSEIQHPFHPLHPLKRHLKNTHKDVSDYECDACQRWTYRFVYQCADCDFRICLRCTALNKDPPLKLVDGKHLMYLYQNTTFERKCGVCMRTDKNTCIFICVIPQCGYAAHIHCSSLSRYLPQSIKHRRHYHPLIYTPSVVEDDSGEYYCELCENLRDEAHPVYFCEGCEFIAHPGCTLSQLLPSLIDDYESDAKAKGTYEDPILAKLDEDIAVLSAKEEEIKPKLEALRYDVKALEHERAEYISCFRQKFEDKYVFDPLRLGSSTSTSVAV